jgi:hypothetical protein
MGLAGAPLIADLANQSDANLARYDSELGVQSKQANDSSGEPLTLAAPILQEVRRQAGGAVADDLAVHPHAGTITVAEIAAQYSIKLRP